MLNQAGYSALISLKQIRIDVPEFVFLEFVHNPSFKEASYIGGRLKSEQLLP